MRLVISMMLILLVIFIIFYVRILYGFDQSVQFSYFILLLTISIAAGGVLFIKDTWKDHRVYIGAICFILLCSFGFGFLTLEKLNEVEVNIVNMDMAPSVHAQFTICGSFKNIPENRDIWLYMVPSMTKKYYPELVPALRLNNGHSEDGSWNYYCIPGVHGFNSAGKSFQIGVFLSNKTDRPYIKNEIMKMNGSINGMDQLPDKIEDLGVQVNVTII